MKTKKTRRIICICLIAVLALGILGFGAVFGINAYVVGSTSDQILSPEDAALLEDVDCILKYNKNTYMLCLS